MKKNMYLSLGVISAAAIMAFSASAAEVTVEDVLSNYAAAGKTIASFVSDAEIKADVTIALPDMDTTMGVTADGALNIQFAKEPLALASTGSVNLNAMGETMDVGIEMYGTTEEDGSLGMYMNTTQAGESSGWIYQGISAEEVQKLIEMINSTEIDLTALPITYTLGDGTVDVNGHSCYAVLSTLTGEDLINLVKFAAEAAGEAAEELPTEELDQIAPLLSAVVVNMEIDVDTETYYPMHMHIDLEDSDWTTLAAVFAQFADLTNEDGSLMTVNLDVSALYLDYTYDYDAAVEVTVPEEAIAAKENGETVSAEELAGEIGDVVEG